MGISPEPGGKMWRERRSREKERGRSGDVWGQGQRNYGAGVREMESVWGGGGMEGGFDKEPLNALG